MIASIPLTAIVDHLIEVGAIGGALLLLEADRDTAVRAILACKQVRNAWSLLRTLGIVEAPGRQTEAGRYLAAAIRGAASVIEP